MTPKQIMDSFSETLMQDERILSAPERALVVSLLQHSKAAAGQNSEIQAAVRKVIASAVGETVAQRAFTVLGGSIVERILESSASSEDLRVSGIEEVGSAKDVRMGPGLPPSPPQSPGGPVRVPVVPQSPGGPLPIPGVPPSPPQSPGGSTDRRVVAQDSVAVLERPAELAARSVVLDEFLAPQELEALMRFTLKQESAFSVSEVLSPGVRDSAVNYDHRRSRVLMELGQYQDLMLERIKGVLPEVLRKLGMEEFPIASCEAQVTASNDGDYFHFHSDNGSEAVASRHLTFVYFFHREPRQFEGGELRIHDSHLEQGQYLSRGSYQIIVPRQNQIVFFPCELMHEITPVKCHSRQFADGRFTVNGWLRR